MGHIPDEDVLTDLGGIAHILCIFIEQRAIDRIEEGAVFSCFAKVLRKLMEAGSCRIPSGHTYGLQANACAAQIDLDAGEVCLGPFNDPGQEHHRFFRGVAKAYVVAEGGQHQGSGLIGAHQAGIVVKQLFGAAGAEAVVKNGGVAVTADQVVFHFPVTPAIRPTGKGGVAVEQNAVLIYRLCFNSLCAGLFTDIQLFHLGIGQLMHHLLLQQLAGIGSEQIAVIELAGDLDGVAILHFQLFQLCSAGHFLHIQFPFRKVVMAVHTTVHFLSILVLHQEENVRNAVVGTEGGAAHILHRSLAGRQIGDHLCLMHGFQTQKFLKGKGNIVLVIELLEGHFHIQAALDHILHAVFIHALVAFAGGKAALIPVQNRTLFAVDLIGAFLIDHFGLGGEHPHVAAVDHTVCQMDLGIGLVHHLLTVVFTNVQASHIIVLVVAEFLDVIGVGVRTDRNTVIHFVQLKGVAQLGRADDPGPSTAGSTGTGIAKKPGVFQSIGNIHHAGFLIIVLCHPKPSCFVIIL